jgi:hypothetical protein
MSKSFLDMRGVSTKIFLAREPSLETSSHTYSTMDPVDGFMTFQARSDTRWHKLSVRLEGKLRKILQLCSVIYTEVFRGVQEVVLPRDVAHPGLQSRIKSAIKFLNIEIAWDAVQAIGSDQFVADQLYRVPFEFRIPEFMSTGFARSWSQQEALWNWHAILPPSVNAPVAPQFWSCGASHDGPGKIQYTVSVAVYRATQDLRLHCIGFGKREIRLRSRPWQTNLLDISPFVEAELSCQKVFTSGLLRRPLGILVCRPVTPPKGHHALGRLNGDRKISFAATFIMSTRFTSHNAKTQPPRLKSMYGEMRETTSYRPEVTTVNPLHGHRVHHKSEIEIIQKGAEHWVTDDVSVLHASGYEDQNDSQGGIEHPVAALQKTAVTWTWSTHERFAPSFSTALMSRWYDVQIWVTYVDQASRTEQSLRCSFPTKLSVEPSHHSVNDNPLSSVPAYSAYASTRGRDEGWLEPSEPLPSYGVIPEGSPE